MGKVYLLATFTLLAGCAATQPESPALALQAAAVTEPLAVLDIADFTSSTTCESVTVTGSRLIRGERCTTTDVDPHVAELERLRREWQINDINRRSQENMERLQREALRQQFPTRRF